MRSGLDLIPSFSVSFDLKFFQFGTDFAIILVGCTFKRVQNQAN
jgi:hypothetical protein